MLPRETERVWEYLKDQPALDGFILIGGTALALHIRHRRSYDLDLAWPELRLPRGQLEVLLRVSSQSGFEFQPDDDEAAVETFRAGGMDLHDYQQNFLVNQAVKVSFFAPDSALSKVLTKEQNGKPRIGTLSELFKSKCLVSALRFKTRDWLDLYVLLKDHGFTMRDFQNAFREAGVESQWTTALSNLCGGVPQRDDEGYAHLLEHAPTIVEMKNYFVAQRNRFEVELAEEAARNERNRK